LRIDVIVGPLLLLYSLAFLEGNFHFTAASCCDEHCGTFDVRKDELHFKHLALDLVDSLGETSYVLAGNTCNGDTAILGGIDGVLFSKSIHLLRR